MQKLSSLFLSQQNAAAVMFMLSPNFAIVGWQQ
jgi:hypothetical protein